MFNEMSRMANGADRAIGWEFQRPGPDLVVICMTHDL
jgi:hypothetical protein